MTLTKEELERLPNTVRKLYDTMDKQKKALEEIEQFGFKNAGCGYSCATMAERALKDTQYK